MLMMPLGCEPSSERSAASGKLVVYCSVDEAFARQVLRNFEKRTDIKLSIIFDSEAGKTTGLVNKIVQEARSGRPRADLFWSSELFNTIRLANDNLLLAYESPVAQDIPDRFKDDQHRWTALAARARVLAYDPKRIRADDLPKRWEELADPNYAGSTALANPLFGTTRGHVSAMFTLWGSDRARSFLTRFREGGGLILDSNGATVRAVLAQRVLLAATDTDDVWVSQRKGASLDLIYPDLGGGGTLIIPCSVALIRGCHPVEQAHRLYDYLVSAEVEEQLFRSDSRNLPVRKALRDKLGVEWPAETRVDYESVTEHMDEAMAAVREILIR